MCEALSSPLRYPGGKVGLYKFFVELIAANSIFGLKYCEPYAGGAGLALRLLSTGFVSHIYLNDLDEGIVALWRSISERTDEFCELVEAAPISIAEWHRQKEIWDKGQRAGLLALGFATYYLNRTNRSGIIEGAGPIGGFAQEGTWKIDARFNKMKQLANIRAIAHFSRQITVSRQDALRFVSEHISDQTAILYLDPPYYVKGRKLYKNFHKHADHLDVSRFLLRNRKHKWVVSYDDVRPIHELYKQVHPIRYQLSYSAGTKSVGNEVIYLSDAFRKPVLEGFTCAA